MGKNQLLVLLIFVPIVGYSQTNISGGIYQNTTWSPSGNPYIASGNVVVFEDVTLTIEPGVLVKFQPDASLEIRGELKALGNSTDSIQFTSNLISPTMNSWKGIIVKGTNSHTGNGNQVIMEYCIGKYAHYFIDLIIANEGPYTFKHCYFGYNYQTNYDAGFPETIFQNCVFDSNKQAIGICCNNSSAINCEFVNNEYGVEGVDLVDSCSFSNNSKVALLCNKMVKNCSILSNHVGVDCAFGGDYKFINNIVMNNDIGIIIQKYYASVDFTRNTICNNLIYNLEFFDFNNANIPCNYWCSSDSSFIRSTIYDGYVNTDYGLLNFMPINVDCPEMHVGVDSELKSDPLPITIYPNPFKDELNIKLNTNYKGEFTIYDLNGQKILSQSITKFNRLNTNNIPPGIFIYRILANEEIIGTGRIVKVE